MTEPPLTESKEARRRAILESAVRVFAEHGFFVARPRAVATGAAWRKPTSFSIRRDG
jgi:TetR/AcrR family transcriptional regulator, fatty acid metabolism regulator protein